MLLERPNQIITREELRRRLWGGNIFVEYESGLNTAANRLRLKLGDSAESPRYVETLARTGYRFIAPVERVDWEPPAAAEPPGPRPPPRASRTLLYVLAVAVFLATIAFFTNRQPAEHRT